MPDETIVVQSRDRTQRTIITWYPDMHEAERHRPVAWVGGGQLHIEDEAPAEVQRRAVNLFRDELTRDPWQDLSYLCTHRQVEAFGPFEPVRRAVA